VRTCGCDSRLLSAVHDEMLTMTENSMDNLKCSAFVAIASLQVDVEKIKTILLFNAHDLALLNRQVLAPIQVWLGNPV
jgi:hypothetical protein